MKKVLLFSSILSCASVYAQLPEDAIKMSWHNHNGSSRYMAIGGTMGSLGGDITAGYVNPAGLAMYRNDEIVLSFGLNMHKGTFNFRESITKNNKNGLILGASGYINGAPTGKTSTRAFAFTINQVADFNSTVQYSSLNNYSSFSEQFAEQFVKSGYSINDVLNSNSPIPYTAAPALYTYLIDTVTIGNTIFVRGAPENILDAGEAIKQEVRKVSSGGIYELGLSYAEGFNEKWQFGVTAGIPLVSHSTETRLIESDTSSRTDNNFKRATYNDEVSTTGAGINLKMGVIYRPQDYIRLGLALHSPSYMLLTETRSSSITNEGEGSLATLSAESELFTNNQPGENRYIQSNPWKAILSGSYVFREVEDTRRQKGFVSADIEYQHHRGGRFHAYDEEGNETVSYQQKKAYFKQVNNIIKDQYKGAFNFRVGGEIKFNIIMARLGFAYYGSPYKTSPEKVYRTMLSGGLGYRHRGFFLDLTYVHNTTRDFDLPYRLEDRENTYSSNKYTRGGIFATLGIKL